MNLMFEKWENGKWYIVLPEYDGDQEDLEMIDGADKLLDYLTPDILYVSIDYTLDDRLDYPLMLELISHDLIGVLIK